MTNPDARRRGDEIVVSVVAPAYNESASLEQTIRAWISSLEEAGLADQQFEIVICDDASTDDSNLVYRMFNDSQYCFRVIHNTVNSGAATSLYRAIAHSRGEFVVLADSDGQFRISDVLRQLDLVRQDAFDAVVGIRKKSDSKLTVLGSKLSTWLMRVLFSRDPVDYNCALKLVRGSVLRSLPLRARGLNYSAEVLIRLLQSNHSITYVEVSHQPRLAGRSSAKLVRDGIARLKFILFLKVDDYLVRQKVLNQSEVRS